ncbi:Hypothetical predicted protein, partial [Mytilus galloprovincialis]
MDESENTQFRTEDFYNALSSSDLETTDNESQQSHSLTTQVKKLMRVATGSPATTQNTTVIRVPSLQNAPNKYLLIASINPSIKLGRQNPIKIQKALSDSGYGHMAGNCSNTRKCRKCGEDHQSNECNTESPKCVNCKGDHPSNYKLCPSREQQKQALKVVKRDNITLHEANKQVKAKANVKAKPVGQQLVAEHTDIKKGYKNTNIIDQVIPIISVAMLNLLTSQTPTSELYLEKVIGFVSMATKQMFGFDYDVSKGLQLANRVTTCRNAIMYNTNHKILSVVMLYVLSVLIMANFTSLLIYNIMFSIFHWNCRGIHNNAA